MACTPLIVRGQAKIRRAESPCYVGKQVPTKRQDILYAGIGRLRADLSAGLAVGEGLVEAGDETFVVKGLA